MKKVLREFIKKEIFGEYGSVAGTYFDIVKYRNMYYVLRNSDGLCIACGKELKGYVGDIIYPQYDGVRYGTGNYYLKSDRHGIICKWKADPDDTYITFNNNKTIGSNEATIHYPNGETYTGRYVDCLIDYYESEKE